MIPPSFLVIGAMKCATTTLYHDLSQNPSISCSEKEDGIFLPSSATPKFSAYARTDSDKVHGEVCTLYSMLPDIQGIPRRVAALLGTSVKIVYLVRNPLRRSISHHQHFFNWTGPGRMGPDINQELVANPQIIQYSCYGMQIEPWIEQFGRAAVRVIRFEDYVSNRASELNGLRDFLGVTADFGPLSDTGENRGDSKRVASAGVLRLYQTNLFRKFIKPYSPSFLRTALRSILLRKAKLAAIAPSPATVDRMLEVLAPDAEKFAKLVANGKLLWDLTHTGNQLKLQPS